MLGLSRLQVRPEVSESQRPLALEHTASVKDGVRLFDLERARRTRRPSGTGTIYRRSDRKGWRAEIEVNRQRRIFYAATRDEAERLLASFLHDIGNLNELWLDVVVHAQRIRDPGLILALKVFASAMVAQSRRKAPLTVPERTEAVSA